MEEVWYKNLGEWLVALEARRDHEIRAHMQPKRRIYGFIDYTEVKHHYIGILDANLTRNQVFPAVYEALTGENPQQVIEG